MRRESVVIKVINFSMNIFLKLGLMIIITADIHYSDLA